MNKILIKKYPNRKFYNTETSDYTSYNKIIDIIKGGNTVVIVDHITKENVTRPVLLKILLKKEGEALQELPESLLSIGIKQGYSLINTSLVNLESDLFKILPNKEIIYGK